CRMEQLMSRRLRVLRDLISACKVIEGTKRDHTKRTLGFKRHARYTTDGSIAARHDESPPFATNALGNPARLDDQLLRIADTDKLTALSSRLKHASNLLLSLLLVIFSRSFIEQDPESRVSP